MTNKAHESDVDTDRRARLFEASHHAYEQFSPEEQKQIDLVTDDDRLTEIFLECWRYYIANAVEHIPSFLTLQEQAAFRVTYRYAVLTQKPLAN